MTTYNYAKYISETEIQYPDYTQYPFKNVPNVQMNDPLHRKFQYYPLICSHTPEKGFWTKFTKFHFVQQTTTRLELRNADPATGKLFMVDDIDPKTNKIVGHHNETREVEIEYDDSYIEVIEWNDIEIPQDQQENNEEELILIERKENAKLYIVKQIIELALKYNAIQDLMTMPITIPDLMNLSKTYNVTTEDWNSTLANIFLYRCELEAIDARLWADIWKELKADFMTLSATAMQMIASENASK